MAGTDSPRDFATEGLVVMKAGDDFKKTPIVLDEVRGDEFLIEMKYSGICHTVSRARFRPCLMDSRLTLLLGRRSAARSASNGRFPSNLWT